MRRYIAELLFPAAASPTELKDAAPPRSWSMKMTKTQLLFKHTQDKIKKSKRSRQSPQTLCFHSFPMSKFSRQAGLHDPASSHAHGAKTSVRAPWTTTPFG